MSEEDELSHGADACPICGETNLLGESQHCQHYLGLFQFEGHIFSKYFISEFENRWQELMNIYDELVDEELIHKFSSRITNKKKKEFITKVIHFLEDETGLLEVITVLSKFLLPKNSLPISGHVEEFGDTLYARYQKKLGVLINEIEKLIDRGRLAINRLSSLSSEPSPKAENSYIIGGNDLPDTTPYLPAQNVVDVLKVAPTNFQKLEEVIDYYKIKSEITLSAGFYQNNVSLNCYNKPWFSPKISWGKLIVKELGFVPLNANQWEAVGVAYRRLPPNDFGDLHEKLSSFGEDGQIKSLKDMVDYYEFSDSYVRPNPSALAFDVIKSLQMDEWLNENGFNCWTRDKFSDPLGMRSIDRRIVFISRSKAKLLSIFLKEKYDLILNLPF